MNTSLLHSSYRILARSIVQRCGMTRLVPQVRDEYSWESFSPESLPRYLADNVPKLKREILLLANRREPYGVAEGRRLRFMVDALIQVRQELDERGQ